jgi:hypothetical protein
LDDDRCEGFDELQMDLWVLPAVSTEHLWQGCEHAGANETNAKEADFAAPYAAGLFEILMYILQGAPGSVEKDFASAGELDGAGGASEEWITEDLFELANLLGERRLSKVETEGCSTEVEFFCDCDKVTEMSEFYVAIHIC